MTVQSKILEGSALEARIPHRYENFLLDNCEILPEDHAEFALTLSDNDSLGRHIFTKNLTQTQSVLLPTASAEILALGSIASSKADDPQKIAIFAGISNFEKTGHLTTSQVLKGTSNKVLKGTSNKESERKGFYKYHGTIRSTGEGECAADVMAFYADKDALQPSDTPKMASLPEATLSDPIPKPSYKDPVVFAADTCTSFCQESYELTAEYTYPLEHPFTKGHFPNNPIMMGIMQWMMIEDAATVILNHLKEKNQTGKFRLRCHANIVKASGALACEIKNAAVDLFLSCDPIIDQTDTVSTQRITFRDIVSPGETLTVHIQPLSFEPIQL